MRIFRDLDDHCKYLINKMLNCFVYLVKSLIFKMIEKNPRQRISIKEIYYTSWFLKFSSSDPQNIEKKIREESTKELLITIVDQNSEVKDTKDKIFESNSYKGSLLKISSSENMEVNANASSHLNIANNQNHLLIPLPKVLIFI